MHIPPQTKPYSFKVYTYTYVSIHTYDHTLLSRLRPHFCTVNSVNKFELDKTMMCTNRGGIYMGQDLVLSLVIKCEAEIQLPLLFNKRERGSGNEGNLPV